MILQENHRDPHLRVKKHLSHPFEKLEGATGMV